MDFSLFLNRMAPYIELFIAFVGILAFVISVYVFILHMRSRREQNFFRGLDAYEKARKDFSKTYEDVLVTTIEQGNELGFKVNEISIFPVLANKLTLNMPLTERESRMFEDAIIVAQMFAFCCGTAKSFPFNRFTGITKILLLGNYRLILWSYQYVWPKIQICYNEYYKQGYISGPSPRKATKWFKAISQIGLLGFMPPPHPKPEQIAPNLEAVRAEHLRMREERDSRKKKRFLGLGRIWMWLFDDPKKRLL